MMLKKVVVSFLVLSFAFAGSTGCQGISSRTVWSTALGCGSGLALGAVADELARKKDAKERQKIENRALGIFRQKKQFNQGKLVGLGVGCMAGLGVGLYLDMMYEDMKEQLGEKGIQLEKVKSNTGETEELLVKMDGDISFDTGKADLKGVASSNVNNLGEALTAYPETKVKIGGHTDATGSRSVNERLSKERAESVRASLVASGIPSHRIAEVSGYANDHPLPGTNTSGADRKNRRVEVRILPK